MIARLWRSSVVALGATLAFLPVALHAQATCKPTKTSNEAKLLAFFSAPLAFSSQGPADRMSQGSLIIAGDLTYVPSPSASIAKTDQCYSPKSENTSLSKVFPRPRIILGLGYGLAVEASYLPPITVMDATPNLGALAVSWTSEKEFLGPLTLGIRGHATFGNVKGPITCPKSALQQTSLTKACYGNTPSEDTYEPAVKGVEATLGANAGTMRWFVGAGYSILDPHFEVGFTNLTGFKDNTTIDVSLTRVTVFGGFAWPVTNSLSVSAQVYSVPEDVTTGRVGIAWRAW